MIDGTRMFVCIIPKDKPLQLGRRLMYSVTYRDLTPKLNGDKMLLYSNLQKGTVYEILGFETVGKNCVYANIRKV